MLRIPGVVRTGEEEGEAHAWGYRATCGDRACMVVVAPEHPAADRERLFRAFRTDIVALARVRHRTIPAVFEMGAVDQRPYAIVEVPAGETLAERLRWGPLPEAEIVAIGTHLLAGLAEVHRRGLWHGGLTPARIVLADGAEDVRILGFGDHRERRERPDGRSARGAPCGRNDLAALGRVLYECATGRPAFAGLTEDPRGNLTELPELSGGNDPLTSPALSKLIATLIGVGSHNEPVNVDSLRGAFERLAAVSTPEVSVPTTEWPGEAEPDPVPFVGRTRPMRLLRETWSEVQTATSRILHVRGAAGSGKTRLVQSFVEDIPRETRLLLKTRCVSGDTRPYAALGELLDGHALGVRADRTPGSRSPDPALRLAADEMAPLLKHLSPELAKLFDGAAELGTPHEVQSLFAEGVAEVLTRLFKSAGPAIVWIDDLQWIDPSSRTVLTRAIDRARGSPTLFILSSRADPKAAAVVESFFRPIRTVTQVDCVLPPFDPDESRQLVEAYLATPGVPIEVTNAIVGLGDGTPMGILDVLRALGTEGVLLPCWGNWRIDRPRLEQMPSLTRTGEMLARRVAALSERARRVIGTAAVLGSRFDEALLERIVDGAGSRSALEEAKEACLVSEATAGECAFVHQTVQEAFIQGMTESDVRAVSGRIAECLEGADDTPSVCRRAAAYAASDWSKGPDRVFRANYEAALRTIAGLDDNRTLSFLTVAEQAARLAAIDPDAEFYQALGEVYLRRGMLSKSRECFEAALTRARDPILRGIVQSRIAWVDYTLGDMGGAWSAIEGAFASLSRERPTGPIGLAKALVSWGRTRHPPRRHVPAEPLPIDARRRLETLCALHHHAARVALESDKTPEFLAHVLQGLPLAERLGPSRALVRNRLAYAFIQVVLGLRERGLKGVDEAEAMALAIRDPVVAAYCLQMRSVIMGWAGDMDAALEVGSRLLLEKGHWLEVSEYCVLCWNQGLMLGLRGQAEAAWQWISRGIDKVRHESHPTEIAGFLEHAARAALGTLGREAELSRHFEGVRLGLRPHSSRGPHYRFALGARIRAFTESADLGPDFEALVREVRSTVSDPARAHLVLSEFYVHVAHARVHRCLRAEEGERRVALAELARSAGELRAMARIPAFTAHLWAVEGYQALFEGSYWRASFLFSRADELAQRENCPWVLYAVARGRAHLHEVENRGEASVAQATLAASIAESHGYAHRLRWIREEFPSLVSPSASAEDTRGPRAGWARRPGIDDRPLDALLQISRTSPDDLNLPEQVTRIIDELLEFLRADRGVVLLSPEAGGAPIRVAGRDAAGQDIADPERCSDLAHRAFQTGRSVLEAGAENATHGTRTMVATPLVLRQRVVGAVCIEAGRPFVADDVRVLELLVSQAAVAIELTRALRGRAEELRERKVLEDELRQAQKMEAIGRLAGTIAHDFNNLLAIITATLDCVQMEHGETLAGELTDIREASDRAASLTGQLLTFARRQASAAQVLQLNTVLAQATPLIRRLLPEGIDIFTDLQSEHDTIVADPNRIEQLLLNLAANARDAMPGGGHLTIATRDAHAPVEVSDDAAADCVLLSVEDTGEGMAPETLRQAFEPFFTTKRAGKGTGLGLATVYGIVQQMHGRITVNSRVGHGTTFFMYFPRAVAPVEKVPPSGQVRTGRPAGLRSQIVERPQTVLLVDDEHLILTALERGLVREGFRVITAWDPLESTCRHASLSIL